MAAIGLGGGCLSLSGYRFSSTLESLVFSAFAGLCFFAHLIFFIGLAGWLYPHALFLLLLLPLFGFLVSFRNTLKSGAGRKEFFSWGASPFWFLITLLVGFGIVSPLVASYAPPISTDELGHHLALPRIFLRQGQIFFRPYHVFSLLPSLMEMLYTLGLALQGTTLAHQMHLVLGLLACLGVSLFARRFLPSPWYWLAGAFCLLTPGINNQLSLAHNDVALMALTLTGFWSVFLWRKGKEMRWLALAGFFLGNAVGTKYTAFPSVLTAITLVAVICVTERVDSQKAWLALCLLVGSTALVGCYWYLRAFLLTGNPVYPYFHHFFGDVDKLIVAFQPTQHGMGKGWLELFFLPWNLTMYQERFGGWGNQLGPLFLAFIPGLLFLRTLRREVTYVLLIISEITILWFYLKQNTRFLFPVLPFFCVLAAYVVHQIQGYGLWSRRLVRIFCIVFLTLQTGILFLNKRDFYLVALGQESSENFLMERVEGYGIAQYVNQNLPADAKILTRELREFYFDRAVERHAGYYAHYAPLCRDEEDLYHLLKKEGFTHLLWKEKIGGEEREWLPEKMIRSKTLQHLGLKKIYEEDVTSLVSKRDLKYSLYQL